MFQIQINKVSLHLEGCPDDGIGAIDYRRALGLESKPTSLVALFDPYGFVDESLCRLVASRLNSQADLDKQYGSVRLPIGVINELVAFQARIKECETRLTDPQLTASERAALVAFLTRVYPSK